VSSTPTACGNPSTLRELTYGTNGFHLPFSDNSTAAALGTDTSGNGNTWTVNNISVTAGAGNDSLVDSPTNGSQVDTGAGGEVVGNYATLNPLDPPTTNFTKTGSNGNLDGVITSSGAGGCGFFTTQAVSTGKWYVEITVNSYSGRLLLMPITGKLYLVQKRYLDVSLAVRQRLMPHLHLVRLESMYLRFGDQRRSTKTRSVGANFRPTPLLTPPPAASRHCAPPTCRSQRLLTAAR
jgi:hypothetical protein